MMRVLTMKSVLGAAILAIAAMFGPMVSAQSIDATALISSITPADGALLPIPQGGSTIPLVVQVNFGKVTVNGAPVAGPDFTTFKPKITGVKASDLLALFQPVTVAGEVVAMRATVNVPVKTAKTGYKPIKFKAKIKSLAYPNPTNPAKMKTSVDTEKLVYTPRANQKPLLSGFSADPSTVVGTSLEIVRGQSVTLTAGASDPDGDPLTYTFDFGDGESASGAVSGSLASKAHTWWNLGNYTARVTITDGADSATTTLPLIVVQGNLPPEITSAVLTNADQDGGVDEFGIHHYVINIGKTANFQFSVDDPDGNPVTSYSLDFGDGSAPQTGTSASGFSTIAAAHNYPATSAVYFLTFSASDGDKTGEGYLVIKVNAAPAVGGINISPVQGTDSAGRQVVNVGNVISFTSFLSDSDDENLEYSFDFGDGEGSYNGNAITYLGQKLALASYAYQKGGNFTVTLSVSDGAASATITLAIRVNRAPTAAIFVDPWQSSWGYPAHIDGLSSKDPDNDPLTYSWNFGDGSTGSGAAVTHTYTGVGEQTRTITLTVTDSWGASATTQYEHSFDDGITGEPMLSVATPLHKGNVAVDTGLPVVVTVGRASVGALADMATLTIKLNKVDVKQYIAQIPAPLRNNNIRYLIGNIPLTVLDKKGRPLVRTDGSNNTLKISIRSVPFINLAGSLITRLDSDKIKFTATVNKAPVANFTVTPPAAGPVTGELFSFNASSSSDPEGQPLSYTWNFGDGSPTETGPTIQHAFAAAGNYTVRLTVSDSVWNPFKTQIVSVSAPVQNPGVTVSQTGGSTDVSEDGATDTFTVVLQKQPTANVTISLSTTPSGQITTTPTSLSFTAANWNTPQVVTVAAVDDAAIEAAQHSAQVRFTVNGGDYSGLSVPDLTVFIMDNDIPATPGVTITQSGGSTNVSEGSTSGDTWSVVLTSSPSSNVTVSANFDSAQVNVTPASLTFSPGNWSTAQQFTVRAVDDAVQEAATHTSVVTHTVTSTDGSYNGIAVASVTVNIADNDAPPSTGPIEVVPASVDFGDVNRLANYGSGQYNNPVRLVQIRNTSASVIRLQSALTTQGIFQVLDGGQSPDLAPGEVHYMSLGFIQRTSFYSESPAQDWNAALKLNIRVNGATTVVNAPLTARTVDSVSGPSPVIYSQWSSGVRFEMERSSVSPTLAKFGPNPFRIANQGDATATISSLALSGPDAAFFSASFYPFSTVKTVDAGKGWKPTGFGGSGIQVLQLSGPSVSRRLHTKLTVNYADGSKNELGFVVNWTKVSAVLFAKGSSPVKDRSALDYLRIPKNNSTNETGSKAGIDQIYLNDSNFKIVSMDGQSHTVNFAIQSVSVGGATHFRVARSSNPGESVTSVSVTPTTPEVPVTVWFDALGVAGSGHHSAMLTITAPDDPGFGARNILLHGFVTGGTAPPVIGSKNTAGQSADWFLADSFDFATVNDDDLAAFVRLTTNAQAVVVGGSNTNGLYFTDDPFMIATDSTGEALTVDMEQWESNEWSDLVVFNRGGTAPFYYTIDSGVFGTYTPGDPENTPAANARLASGTIGSGGILRYGSFINNNAVGNAAATNEPDFSWEGEDLLDIAGADDGVNRVIFYTQTYNESGVARTQLEMRVDETGVQRVITGMDFSGKPNLSRKLTGLSGLEVSELIATKAGSNWRLFVILDRSRFFHLDVSTSGAYVASSELTNLYTSGKFPDTDCIVDRNGNWYVTESGVPGVLRVYKINLMTGAGQSTPWVQTTIPAADEAVDAQLGLRVDQNSHVWVQTLFGCFHYLPTGAPEYYINAGNTLTTDNQIGSTDLENAWWDLDFDFGSIWVGQ